MLRVLSYVTYVLLPVPCTWKDKFHHAYSLRIFLCTCIYERVFVSLRGAYEQVSEQGDGADDPTALTNMQH